MGRLQKISALAATIYIENDGYDEDDSIEEACNELNENITDEDKDAIETLIQDDIEYEKEERYIARCDCEAGRHEWEMHFR